MKALLSGITGMAGSYLAELLLEKGYEVHGIIRRSSSFNTGRIDHIFNRLELHYGDLTDGTGLCSIINKVDPDEVYNLGCQSHVKVSFDQPVYTVNTVAIGTLCMLEAVRQMKRPAKFYQASSSEMFGSSPPPQNESTPFKPQSPYACAKVYAYHQVQNYRDAYNMFACNGILFNHESPRRGETFVTRKITRAVTRIKLGLQDKLYLGNLTARRDWGFAGDYVKAMWLMLQQYKPDDYVVATGKGHSVLEFVEAAFEMVGLNWSHYIELDRQYIRPTEVNALRGDAAKARNVLGWKPEISFIELVEMMMDADMELAKKEKANG